MKRLRRTIPVWVSFALLVGVSEGISSELYCAVNFAGIRCWYPDLASCRQAAGPQGDCIINKERMQKAVGGAPVCMVESWQTQCIYPDRIRCRQAAIPRQAVCIDNPNYR